MDHLRRAAAMVPENPLYHERLGRALEWEGTDGAPSFRTALALNPRITSLSIRLAQSAERTGNTAEAERILLHAAELDRTFDPRWALANFYFRQGTADPFWHWVGLALERGFGDGRTVYELCARMPGGDERLDDLIRDEPETLARYLTYRLEGNRLPSIERAALRLVRHGRKTDAQLLLAACDRLLTAERASAALALWNQSVAAHVFEVPHSPGNLVNNPAFEARPLEAGFDWRRGSCEGFSVEQAAAPAALRIEAKGNQPDRCDLVSQYLLSPAAGTLTVDYEYRASGPPPAGFGWHLCVAAHCVDSEPGGAPSGEAGWLRTTARLPVAAGAARLVYSYQRPLGTSRYEGTLSIRNVQGTVR